MSWTILENSALRTTAVVDLIAFRYQLFQIAKDARKLTPWKYAQQIHSAPASNIR